MDFDNHPKVKTAWKHRPFSTRVCPKSEHYIFMRVFMCRSYEAYKRQNKVLEPMMAACRAILFKHEKNEEWVKIRNKKFKLQWNDQDTVNESMEGGYWHCIGKEKEYYANIKNNKKKRKKSDVTDEDGSDSESSGSDSESSGSSSNEGSSDDGQSPSEDENGADINQKKVCHIHL